MTQQETIMAQRIVSVETERAVQSVVARLALVARVARKGGNHD